MVTIEDTAVDWEMSLLAGLLILAIGAAWRQLAKAFSAWWFAGTDADFGQVARTCAERSDVKPVEAELPRSVMVQAQTTYRRDLTQPRFQPLPDHSHGAWHQ